MMQVHFTDETSSAVLEMQVHFTDETSSAVLEMQVHFTDETSSAVLEMQVHFTDETSSAVLEMQGKLSVSLWGCSKVGQSVHKCAVSHSNYIFCLLIH